MAHLTAILAQAQVNSGFAQPVASTAVTTQSLCVDRWRRWPGCCCASWRTHIGLVALVLVAAERTAMVASVLVLVVAAPFPPATSRVAGVRSSRTSWLVLVGTAGFGLSVARKARASGFRLRRGPRHALLRPGYAPGLSGGFGRAGGAWRSSSSSSWVWAASSSSTATSPWVATSW